MERNEFWGRVQRLIAEQGTKQDWVAKQIPARPDSFSRWIQRDVMPKVDDADKIAKALGTTIDFLLYGEDRTDPWLREHALFIRDCKDLDMPQMTGLAANAHILAEANRMSRIPANAHTSA